MPTRIPYTFSKHTTTKIPAVDGWVFVKPMRDDRFYVTASNRRAETVGERDIYYTVVDLVNSLGGPIPYMPANSTESSAEIIVSNLLEGDDFDAEAYFVYFLNTSPSKKLAKNLVVGDRILLRDNTLTISELYEPEGSGIIQIGIRNNRGMTSYLTAKPDAYISMAT